MGRRKRYRVVHLVGGSFLLTFYRMIQLFLDLGLVGFGFGAATVPNSNENKAEWAKQLGRMSVTTKVKSTKPRF